MMQSWAHATSVATIGHRFKANKLYSIYTYCVETQNVDSEGQFFTCLTEDLLRCRVDALVSQRVSSVASPALT